MSKPTWRICSQYSIIRTSCCLEFHDNSIQNGMMGPHGPRKRPSMEVAYQLTVSFISCVLSFHSIKYSVYNAMKMPWQCHGVGAALLRQCCANAVEIPRNCNGLPWDCLCSAILVPWPSSACSYFKTLFFPGGAPLPQTPPISRPPASLSTP
jgi:hypothetical protein